MKKGKNRQVKLGIFLMVFSGVFFGATFIIPLFDLPTKTKVIASTTSLVLMEVVFWAGGLLVGKELFTKYKKNSIHVTGLKRKNPVKMSTKLQTKRTSFLKPFFLIY